jgi:DNA-binding winged helix-turn-helix (wHTH) protein/Tol biopolymer transport system component
MAYYRFGPFELDAARGELRKNGTRIPIQNQPFQVLRTLVERPDHVISREDLRQAIWASDTFVDFEHGLNAAMSKIRRALGDAAEGPRYIETVPGKGYRFIAPVKNHEPAPRPAPSVQDGSRDSIGRPMALGATKGDEDAWRAGFSRHIDERQASASLPGPDSSPARTNVPPSSSVSKKWVIGAVIAAALVGGLAMLLKTPDRAAHLSVVGPVVEFSVAPPPGSIFAPPLSRQEFAISPDGARLVFTATGPNGTSIWIRELASLDMRPVAGTEGAWSVFWSPDSRSVYFSVKRVLKEANLDTGSTRSVGNLPFLAALGTWRAKGDLLLYLGPHSIYELNVANGALKSITGLDLRLPQFLPHSDHVLNLFVDPTAGGYRARVSGFESGTSAALMLTDSKVQYASPSHPGEPGMLLYVRQGSLLAQPFEAERSRLAGEPLPIAQNVVYFGPSAQASFSVSDNGALVVQSGWPLSELHWYDRAGREVGTLGQPAPYVGTLRISPDGRYVAAGIWTPASGAPDLWLFTTDGRESRRLTYPPASHARPVWSPDGNRLAFTTSRISAPFLATLALRETGGEQPVMNQASREEAIRANQIQMPTDWSRDGRFIAFDTGLGEEEQEAWLADTSNGNVMPLLRGESAHWAVAFSPEGRHIAFLSAESGTPEVYVQGFDPLSSPHLVGVPSQLSTGGAWFVRWRPDGRELFYVGIDNRLYAVPVRSGFQLGEPKALYRIPGIAQYGTTSDFQFDVSRDGQRFIMSTTGSVSAPPFTVIGNWQEKFHR